MNIDYINEKDEIVIPNENGSITILEREYQEYIHELIEAKRAQELLAEHPLTSDIIAEDNDAAEKLIDCFMSAKDEAVEALYDMLIKQALLVFNYVESKNSAAEGEEDEDFY